MSVRQEHKNISMNPELVSELFHALNQPLTTLQCSLELAMMKPTSIVSGRGQLEAALQEVEQITAMTGKLRETIEAFMDANSHQGAS
jgi:hypothetical protein